MKNAHISQARWVFPLAVAVLLLAGTVDGLSAHAQDEAKLLESIRENWKSLQQPTVSASYRLVSRMSISKPGTDLLPVNEREIIYHDSPEGLVFDNRTTEYEDGGKRSERELLLVNKSYATQLREQEKEGQWIVVDRPKMYPDDVGRGRIAESQPFHRMIWFAPARTYRLSALIDPSLTQVTKVESIGDDLVRINFRAKPNLSVNERDQLGGVTSGWLLLNKRWHYRMEEAEINYSPETQHRSIFKCHFLDTPGQEHLIRTMTTDTKFRANNESSLRVAKTVREFENLPPTDDSRIFYMSYYGLPEPEGVTAPSGPLPLWVWLLIASAVFALTAFTLFVILGRRSRRAASQTVPPPAG
jgi:hypothetical protein